jgi:hypothetical protein
VEPGVDTGAEGAVGVPGVWVCVFAVCCASGTAGDGVAIADFGELTAGEAGTALAFTPAGLAAGTGLGEFF